MAAPQATDPTTFAGSQGCVSAVVAPIQAELDDLLAQKEEIRQRIQDLHQVVYGLQETNRLSTDDLYAESPKPNRGRRTSHHASCGVVVDERAVVELRPCVRGKAKYVHPALRRASRIALLEAEGVASLEEIYSRIVRRGSFAFESLRLALPLVARALNIMTEAGELRCEPWRWQRLVRPEDLDADLAREQVCLSGVLPNSYISSMPSVRRVVDQAISSRWALAINCWYSLVSCDAIHAS